MKGEVVIVVCLEDCIPSPLCTRGEERRGLPSCHPADLSSPLLMTIRRGEEKRGEACHHSILQTSPDGN
jgi:hypothetical protein